MKEDYERQGEQERPTEGSQEEHRPGPEAPRQERNDPREEKRARVYGLHLDDLLDQSVVVSAGKHVRLSGIDRKKPERGLVRLQPRDLADVKRWIGVPDELGARRSGCHSLPAEIPGVSTGGDLRKLDPSSQRAIRDLAHEFVYGDSRRLTPYKTVLNSVVDRAVITGVFLREDIDIHTGAVLEIGADVKVLFARHIRIWRGGLLKLAGATKIDCVTVTGGLLNLVMTVDLLPTFATYFVEETANG